MLLRDVAGAIRRAVIDEHESIRGPRLAGHGREERKEAPFLIEEWNDDDDNQR